MPHLCETRTFSYSTDTRRIISLAPQILRKNWTRTRYKRSHSRYALNGAYMHGMYTHGSIKTMRSSCYLVVGRPTTYLHIAACLIIANCQTHFVTLVARMRSETRGTRKLVGTSRPDGISAFTNAAQRFTDNCEPSFKLSAITRERFVGARDSATRLAAQLCDELSLTYNLADRPRLANVLTRPLANYERQGSSR